MNVFLFASYFLIKVGRRVHFTIIVIIHFLERTKVDSCNKKLSSGYLIYIYEQDKSLVELLTLCQEDIIQSFNIVFFFFNING